MTLHVTSFSGGAVLAGAVDTRGVDEVLAADSYDLGPRGALVCTSDAAPYVTLLDGQGVALSQVYGLVSAPGVTTTADTLAVGAGTSATGLPAVLLTAFAREGQASPVALAGGVLPAPAPLFDTGTAVAPLTTGHLVTGVVVPGTFPLAFAAGTVLQATTLTLVNVGAREGALAATAPGLYVVVTLAGTPTAYPIQKFDALGTGPFGSLLTDAVGVYGGESKQLFFRGIAGYNGYVFGWGYDSVQSGNGEGPCRLMFCNAGKPLVWGNDNGDDAGSVPPVKRAFTDSDAIVFGSTGERIRAGLALWGKFFIGTNRGLHFLQGYGRDTFTTNGATPLMQAFNVVGPHALLEGPDRRMYGVGDQGLWRYDGAGLPEPLFQRVVDFRGQSPGYFDCLWTDQTRAAGVPGTTNTDLVWLAADWQREQVVVGIPYCNAATGGPGSDTVLLKYHTAGGGFTRQVLAGVAYANAGYYRSEGTARATRLLAAPGGVARYGYTASSAGSAPALPAALPHATLGPYAPFGPDGAGVVARAYLTLAWADAHALPLVFALTLTLDDGTADASALTVAPFAPDAPRDGDRWCDTSGSDPSLGNRRAGATVAATGGFLLFTWHAGSWRLVPGVGATGTRVTLPLPLPRRAAARVTLDVRCTAARGRFQLEGLGLEPGAGVAAA